MFKRFRLEKKLRFKKNARCEKAVARLRDRSGRSVTCREKILLSNIALAEKTKISSNASSLYSI